MSVLVLGSSIANSVLDLLKQSSAALKTVNLGAQPSSLASNVNAAQEDFLSIQQDLSLIEKKAAASVSEAWSDSSPFRSSIKGDMSKLATAVGAADVKSVSADLLQLRSDTTSEITTLTSGFPAPPVQTPSPDFLRPLKSLLTSASSGDNAGTQLAVNTLNQDLHEFTNSLTTSLSSPKLDQNQERISADLESLINAAQKGTVVEMKGAAQILASDLKSSLGV